MARLCCGAVSVVCECGQRSAATLSCSVYSRLGGISRNERHMPVKPCTCRNGHAGAEVGASYSDSPRPRQQPTPSKTRTSGLTWAVKALGSGISAGSGALNAFGNSFREQPLLPGSPGAASRIRWMRVSIVAMTLLVAAAVACNSDLYT